MSEFNTHNLKEAIQLFLKDTSLDDKAQEMRIITHWNELVGKVISSRTERVFIKEKKLFIKTNSSVLKNELVYLKQAILEKIGTAYGENIVTEIVLL